MSKKKKAKEGLKGWRLWFNRIFWVCFFAPPLFLGVLMLLISFDIFGDIPSFDELENPTQNRASEIISEDGIVLGSFFVENRMDVSYHDISPNVINALVATEDERFYSHSGIDFKGLSRVIFKTVVLQDRKQGGGSTITQQLAKNLYPRDTVSNRGTISKASRILIMKLKEWVTALKLEHNYTKEEIATMYLNTVSFGSNAFGIKSAANTFFSKEPINLSIAEAAVLVGTVNAPSYYSPVRNPDRSKTRRNLVLSRLEKSGFISAVERDSLSKTDLELDYNPFTHNTGKGTYFRESLRLFMTARKPQRRSFYLEWDYRQDSLEWENNALYGWCNKNLKEDGTPYNLYKDGLKIYTTINSKMQAYAETSIYNHMKNDVQKRFNSQVRYSGEIFQDVDKEMKIKIISNAMKNSDRYRNCKKANSKMSDSLIFRTFNKPAHMRIFTYSGEKDTIMKPIDSIYYYKKMLRASMVAINPSNGHVKAYVGGVDFKYFKYDMVKQGKRQVGSTIKPFVYTLAMQEGMTPCTIAPNLPVSFDLGNGTPPWTPHEATAVSYTGEMVPLRWGLSNSRNNITAWVMKQFSALAVSQLIYRFGIKSYMDPVPSLCLGAADISLYEMVGGYCAFVNKGVHTEPIIVKAIEDKNRNSLATFSGMQTEVISENIAHTMIEMLKDVVRQGTARRVSFTFVNELGGKTGSSQNYSDNWYIGLAPKLVVGVWVGGEDRSIRLSSSAGGSVVALPPYVDFMAKVYADTPLGVSKNDKFLLPRSGFRANISCPSKVPAPLPEVTGYDDETH